jgi:hypothetical protein
MSGFGGLAVSMLASGTQDRGFAPNRSRRIFPAGKIHSMPSFGRGSKIIYPMLVTRTAKGKKTGQLWYKKKKKPRPKPSDFSCEKNPQHAFQVLLMMDIFGVRKMSNQ